MIRSPQSLVTYGPNLALLIRPDSAIFVVHTSLGYLITYSLATDAAARVYRLSFPASHSRRQHDKRRGAYEDAGYPFGPPGAEGPFHEVSLRFRMAIKVDAGINAALALEDELVVATKKPPAVQCIRWSPDSSGNQTSTELMSRLPWFTRNGQIVGMVYDRPMNIFVWITSNGQAYAVQKNSSTATEQADVKMMFRGHRFHHPEQQGDHATAAAVNARFSLIAVGTAAGSVHVYTLRDYAGNIPLSHHVQPSVSSSGGVRVLAYSPDGYCLFAGFEQGWMTGSVFGKPNGNSFSVNRAHMEENQEDWLGGVRGASWVGAGSEVLLLGENDSKLRALELARSAAAGCLSSANISRSLLLTKAGFMVYRGYDLPDLTSISAEATLWQTVQVPASYLEEQGPIRSAVVSPDGRYVAVAGRHGLAHYSISSGRWKTFEDKRMENEFTVRGGMCWHQHILIVAVETDDSYQVRLLLLVENRN